MGVLAAIILREEGRRAGDPAEVPVLTETQQSYLKNYLGDREGRKER